MMGNLAPRAGTRRPGLAAVCLASASLAAGAGPGRLRSLTLAVDGVDRTALVYTPTTAAAGGTPAPLVFVYHGHGGTARAAEQRIGIDRLWPAAISVYPQGLDTPGPVTDPAGLRAGWQHATGLEGDRDLHFFDALLARVERDAAVDRRRVYCTGHSNGGGFTYLLWLNRPAVFAAVAPCSAGGLSAAQLTPKPAMVCGGLDDPTVPFDHQRQAMDAVRRVDGCEAVGQPWADGCTLYPSKTGTPVVTFVYRGGHAMDPSEPGLIVRFFREHAGPTTRPASTGPTLKRD